MSKKEEEKVAKSINSYLEESKNINLIIQILDIRHKITENDITMIKYLEHFNIPYILIFNKADKIAITKINDTIEQRKKEISEKINMKDIAYYLFSSEKKIYNEAIWNCIYNVVK